MDLRSARLPRVFEAERPEVVAHLAAQASVGRSVTDPAFDASVNIGNPKEMTLLQLAQQIARLSGSRSEIVFRPLPTDDPKVRQPDIGKARRLLKWEPKVDVEEGLTRTIDWCRKLVAQP
jgi:nucleoside-diphosphate-sugar epimerase